MKDGNGFKWIENTKQFKGPVDGSALHLHTGVCSGSQLMVWQKAFVIPCEDMKKKNMTIWNRELTTLQFQIILGRNETYLVFPFLRIIVASMGYHDSPRVLLKI